MPPLISSVPADCTEVVDVEEPRAFAPETRNAPDSTTVLPVQLLLFPESIKRPVPLLIRLPSPVRVAANAGAPKPAVPIVESPVAISKGPDKLSVIPSAASAKPAPALRVRPPEPVVMLELSWIYPEASRVRFVAFEE